MIRRLGWVIVGIAALHTVVGLVVYRRPLAGMARDGVVATVGERAPERDAAFWFVLWGWLLGLVGVVVQWATDRGLSLPRSLGWGVLAMGLVGSLAMPVSGAWLVLAAGVALVANRAHRRP